MADDKIINLTSIEDCIHVVQPFIGLSCIYSVKQSDFFIINYVSDTPGIILPRLTDIRNTLGIGSDVNFALPLTICGHISTQGFKIIGREGVTGQSSVYPKLRNKSTNDIDSINMAGGDVLKLLLVYDGGEYYAYTVSFVS